MIESAPEKQRNHFVPEFYLKRWYEPELNGFWLYYRDERGNLILRQNRAAKSVGYKNGLYALLPEGLASNKSNSNEIEDVFFSTIDNQASKIHTKLIDKGIAALTIDDRFIWALFINSLIERVPSRIRDWKIKISGIFDEMLTELESRKESASIRNRILSQINSSALINNTALRAVIHSIVDESFIQYVTKMKWLTIDLPEGNDHYLTGDRPVVINAKDFPTYPIYTLSIAISPSRLLVMHKDEPEFNTEFIKKMAVLHNPILTKQTDKYLVSSKKLIDTEFIKYSRIVETMLSDKSL